MSYQTMEETSTATARVKSSAGLKSKEKCAVDKSIMYNKITQRARFVVVASITISFLFRDVIQEHINSLWDYVKRDSFFQSAHFETVYVTIVYSLLMIMYPFTMHYIPFLQRFKISDEITYVHQSILHMGKELLFHLTPLLIADALIIKRYSGVPYSKIAAQKSNWIVRTRSLPDESPEYITMCLHVLGSVIIYDLQFFLVHYTMHRNWFLYKHFHAIHHAHEVVHAHVTNQLSVVERGLQVIAANYALKLFGCHPLTRLVFVPVFLWLLIENHTGYDLPWGVHRLCPGGLMGGPAYHYAHHTQGSGHYQPFFTYLDNLLVKHYHNNKRKTIKEK